MATEAAAQQRPLTTQDPETIGAGRLLVEGGLDYGFDQRFPLSGLEGNLLRVPLVGISIGISSIAELQVDGGFFNRLSVKRRTPAPLARMLDFSGDSTHDFEDLIVATKVRFVSESAGRPGMAVHFATRLPTASNESGLGLDTTDFFALLALGKTIESVRIVTNVGVGVLADPTRGDHQNDVLLYGVSVARALSGTIDVVGEINGRADVREDTPPGTESRAAGRIGLRFTRNPIRWDAGLSIGLTAHDPDVALMAGMTIVFDAFRVP